MIIWFLFACLLFALEYLAAGSLAVRWVRFTFGKVMFISLRAGHPSGALPATNGCEETVYSTALNNCIRKRGRMLRTTVIMCLVNTWSLHVCRACSKLTHQSDGVLISRGFSRLVTWSGCRAVALLSAGYRPAAAGCSSCQCRR